MLIKLYIVFIAFVLLAYISLRLVQCKSISKSVILTIIVLAAVLFMPFVWWIGPWIHNTLERVF